ncbi:MAG TPA: carboxypeptidase-like regulatory domain-containing protein [Vicinamibacterales bacterium]|nr:carboxypeptidase-like regulatory domain-containing protein [Vicinamibacterales bacterium]
MAPELRLTGSLAVLVFCSALSAAPRQLAGGQAAAPTPGGFILGRAVDGTTGKALAGAQVSLNSATQTAPALAGAPPATLSRFPMRVISDGNGAFVFRDLPAGSYSITATRSGYAVAALGRNSATDTGSQLVTLTDGEKRGGVTLKFWKFGSISGTVRDEAGESLIGIQLRIFRRAVLGGRLRLTSFGNMPTTDDRGIYRAGELAPGDYIIGVVTTQATVPISIQDLYEASTKDGSSSEFRRQLDRSGSTVLGGGNLTTAGTRYGTLLLQGGAGFNSSTVINPPGDESRVFVYPTTFFPSATVIGEATVLTVGAGEDRTGTDFHLKPVPTTRVSGRLVGSDTEAANTALTLVHVSTGDVQRDYDLATATTFADGTGAFTFLGVPPGDYTVRALKVPPRPIATTSPMSTVIQTGTGGVISSGGGPTPPPPIPPEPTWWASTAVVVTDRDVSGLTVTLRQGARLSGTLEFDGAAERPAADRLRLTSLQFEQADARQASFNQFTLQRAVVDANGQFKTYQLPPGKYVVRAAGIPGWTLRSAVVRGKDVADSPFDLTDEDLGNIVVTFTDKVTEMSGTVRNPKGPDPSATVLVFPVDTSLWIDHGPAPRRFRAIRAGADSTYRLTGIAAGEYLAVAIPGGTPVDWIDPRYLQKLAAVATRLTVIEGEKKSLGLDTKEVRR